jgi:hypothetical protein
MLRRDGVLEKLGFRETGRVEFDAAYGDSLANRTRVLYGARCRMGFTNFSVTSG